MVAPLRDIEAGAYRLEHLGAEDVSRVRELVLGLFRSPDLAYVNACASA